MKAETFSHYAGATWRLEYCGPDACAFAFRRSILQASSEAIGETVEAI